ncbi:MAG TPA: hypothetical protein VK961_13770 [Chthoniobacter sp.]|nr:hypothetical protein [Chthoniobacter sp.]
MNIATIEEASRDSLKEQASFFVTASAADLMASTVQFLSRAFRLEEVALINPQLQRSFA